MINGKICISWERQWSSLMTLQIPKEKKVSERDKHTCEKIRSWVFLCVWERRAWMHYSHSCGRSLVKVWISDREAFVLMVRRSRGPQASLGSCECIYVLFLWDWTLIFLILCVRLHAPEACLARVCFFFSLFFFLCFDLHFALPMHACKASRVYILYDLFIFYNWNCLRSFWKEKYVRHGANNEAK